MNTGRAARRAAVGHALAHVRRRYYVERRNGRFVAALPMVARNRIGLDDPAAVASRRIEVGGGPHALNGHIHVDVDPGADHLEAVAPAWQLPFPDGWATQIVSIHSLEHVPGPKLLDTLREWHRVLAAEGTVRIHVPNGPELFETFLKSPPDGKWPIIGSLLGMYCSPDANQPESLYAPADHRLIFDFPLLSWALTTAGFTDVMDLTGTVEDRHTLAWADSVPRYSLVVTAVR
jgi:SAM-dependent methyltransferase